MNSRIDYSVIVPVFNEGEGFPAFMTEVDKKLPTPRAMHIVYDFDEDSTVPVARSYCAKRPWLKLTHNNLGRGPLNAIRTGFNQVESGPVLVLMADLSDDLDDVKTMLERYDQGARIVCASRYMRGGKQIGGPLLKRFLSWLAGQSLFFGFGFPTQDATNNFRLYDSDLVRELEIESTEGFELAIELTAKAHCKGVKIEQIPTIWRDRTTGKSNFKLFKWLPAYLRWYCYAATGRKLF